jgi:Fe-S-cluster containining protein
MKIDKDKPWTWIQYKDGMCNTCIAACCMMPVEVHASDLVRLGVATIDEEQISHKKMAKRLIKQGVIKSYRDASDLFMISSRANGDCYFLDAKTRRCTVYEKRPETCRKFPIEIGPKPGSCPCTQK